MQDNADLHEFLVVVGLGTSQLGRLGPFKVLAAPCPQLFLEASSAEFQRASDALSCQASRAQIVHAALSSFEHDGEWHTFNDTRFNGAQPLAYFAESYPNLRLVSTENRHFQVLSVVLRGWFDRSDIDLTPPCLNVSHERWSRGSLELNQGNPLDVLIGLSGHINLFSTISVRLPFLSEDLQQSLSAYLVDQGFACDSLVPTLWRRDPAKIQEKLFASVQSQHWQQIEALEARLTAQDEAYKHELLALSGLLDSKDSQIHASQEKLEHSMVNERDVSSLASQLQRDIAQSSAALSECLQQHSSCLSAVSALEGECLSLRQELTVTKERLATTQDELERASLLDVEQASYVAQLQVRIEKSHLELVACQESKVSLALDVSELQTQLLHSRQKLSLSEQRLASSHDELEHAALKAEELADQVALLQSDREDSSKTLVDLRRELEAQHSTISDQSEKLSHLRDVSAALGACLDATQKELNSAFQHSDADQEHSIDESASLVCDQTDSPNQLMLVDHIHAGTTQLDVESATGYDSLSTKAASLVSELLLAKKLLDESQLRLAAKTDSLTALESSYQALQINHAQLKAESELNLAHIEEKRLAISNLNDALEASSALVLERESSNQSLIVQRDNLLASQLELTAERDALQAKNVHLEDELKNVTIRLNASESQREDSTALILSLNCALEKEQSNLVTLEAHLAQLQSSHDQLATDLSLVKSSEQQYVHQMATIEQELNVANERLAQQAIHILELSTHRDQLVEMQATLISQRDALTERERTLIDLQGATEDKLTNSVERVNVLESAVQQHLLRIEDLSEELSAAKADLSHQDDLISSLTAHRDKLLATEHELMSQRDELQASSHRLSIELSELETRHDSAVMQLAEKDLLLTDYASAKEMEQQYLQQTALIEQDLKAANEKLAQQENLILGINMHRDQLVEMQATLIAQRDALSERERSLSELCSQSSDSLQRSLERIHELESREAELVEIVRLVQKQSESMRKMMRLSPSLSSPDTTPSF